MEGHIQEWKRQQRLRQDRQDQDAQEDRPKTRRPKAPGSRDRDRTPPEQEPS